MAKGLAVISGSNSVVFKALETGVIVMGQDVAANVTISGSLKLNVAGAGVDKFLVSDVDGNATWTTIQIAQVQGLQTALDSLSGSVGGDLDSIELRLSQEESARAAADTSIEGAISTAVANLVDGAPAILDTLNELAAALNDDENFAATVAGNIAAEQSARIAGDASLDSKVSTETSARVSADTSIDARLDAVDGFDLSLETRLSQEEVARASADTSLEAALSGETSARVSADGSLDVRLSGEESVRASADVSLEGAISAEESARISADGSIDVRLSGEESVRASADQSLASGLSAEESARVSADQSLDTKISSETSRAESVEASLAASISASGEGNLNAAYSYTDSKVAALVDSAPEVLDTLNELAAALGDDPNFATTVASNIAGEQSARVSADASLASGLSTEVSTRASADASLATALSGEESARVSADGSLATALSGEESARVSADASIVAQLSGLADNQIIVQGTANEVEVSGGTVTLSEGGTITLGLPNDVVISSSLTVNGDVTVGVGPVDDLLTINSKMRITHVDRASGTSVLTEYSDAAALAAGDFDGHMFYLKGADDANSMFAQGNKWYFCENGVWHSSFFYVG